MLDTVTPFQTLPSILQDPRALFTPYLPQAKLLFCGVTILLVSQLLLTLPTPGKWTRVCGHPPTTS